MQRAEMRNPMVAEVTRDPRAAVAEHEPSDDYLTWAAMTALDAHIVVPADGIQVTVREGWITLEGEVDWKHQRVAASDIMGQLHGVRGVLNLLTVKAMRPLRRGETPDPWGSRSDPDLSSAAVETSHGPGK